MRVFASALARTLSLFLVIAVAHVPIICADERPSDDISSSSGRPADDHGSVKLSQSETGSEDGPCCFCPCHSTFRSAEGFQLLPSGISAEQIGYSGARATPGPPRSLDHPPQNLR
jgi:hypothetical protein